MYVYILISLYLIDQFYREVFVRYRGSSFSLMSLISARCLIKGLILAQFES